LTGIKKIKIFPSFWCVPLTSAFVRFINEILEVLLLDGVDFVAVQPIHHFACSFTLLWRHIHFLRHENLTEWFFAAVFWQ
jgi:hypothetical protein